MDLIGREVAIGLVDVRVRHLRCEEVVVLEKGLQGCTLLPIWVGTRKPNIAILVGFSIFQD